MENIQNNVTVPAIKKTSSVLKWSIIIGIVIVLNLFINYSVSLVYKQPTWENYFSQSQVVEPINNKEECLKVGGQWTVDAYTNQNYPTPAKVVDGKLITGYCNPDFIKQQNFNDDQKVYNRNVFIVLVIFGVIAVVVGVYLSAISAVSLGLSFGGVVSFIIGSIRYWSDMQDWVRVAVLALALVALIWVAVKKIKE